MNVTSAQFDVLTEPPIPEWIIRVTAKADGLERRAIPIAARVGDVPVVGLVINPDDAGFTGYLTSEPEDGAHLFAGYMEGAEDLPDTGIAYQRSNV